MQAHTNTLENLERLRFVSGVTESQWLDSLKLTRKEYALMRSGLRPMRETNVAHLAQLLDLNPTQILTGDVDFHAIQRNTDRGHWEMPEVYAKANYGRRRTTITTFDYLEKIFGWRVRYDVLQHLNMSELMLEDEFAPVSMQFITDACGYLAKRRFRHQDFFNMGLYTFEANRHSILGRRLAEFSSTKEVLQHMWGDLLPLLEQNCIYRFLRLSDTSALLEITSDPHVAAEMGKSHLGNEHICSLKSGMLASAPAYIGQPFAHVHEKSCVHKGEDRCLFEIEYPLNH